MTPEEKTPMGKRVAEEMKNTLGYLPTIVLTYSGPDYQTFHWITNVTRQQGIALATETVKQMQAEIN